MAQRLTSERGFTLLEVLAGLLVSALIMVGLNTTSSTINRGFELTKASLSRQNSIASGIDVFSDDVSRILRVPDNAEAPKRFLFSGTSDEIVYLMEERPRQSAGEVNWIKLSIRNTDPRATLSRMRIPYAAGQTEPEAESWTDDITLIGTDADFSFSYRAPGAGLREWTSNWTIANRMPEQIRLTIQDKKTGRLRIPSFVQSLKIDAEHSCATPNSPSCTIRTAGILGGPR